MILKKSLQSKVNVGLMGLAAKPIPPEKGNICAPNEVVYHLACGLKNEGYGVTVFTGEDSSSELNKVSLGLKSTWNQYGTDNELSNEVYTKRRIEYERLLSEAAVDYWKKGLIDFVNSHDFRTNPEIFAQSNVPVLYTVHGDLSANPLMSDAKHLSLLKRKNVGFLNISQDNVKVCHQKGLNNIFYTPNGVDINKFTIGHHYRDGIIVVARMIEAKKIKESIRIAVELGERITLIGPPGQTDSEKAYFEELSNHYFNQNNVRYLGYLPQEEIASYYQKAKAMLFISEGEGMPLAVLEAQASGLPVVANKKGGVKEILKEGKTGYLINDIENKNEVGSLLSKAIELDSVECRNNVISNYSYDKMVENYISAYKVFWEGVKDEKYN